MRLTGSRAYARPAPPPTMPPGLVELMEGLAKDVLKYNPENVYEFCAGHMQKLLEIRDGPAPPQKQLSLDQKIAKAQEKIRQRIKYRHLQRDINTSERRSNENPDLEDEPPVIEIPMESTSVIHPVIEIPNENKSAIQTVEKIAIESTSTIQPAVEITNENTSAIPPVVKTAIEKKSAIEAVVQTAIENTAPIQPVIHGEKLIVANEVEISHEPDVFITTNEKSTDEASNPEHDNDVQSNVASPTTHEPKNVVVATQKLDTANFVEKNIEKVKENVGVDTKQISDTETNVESGNVTDVEVQSNNDVDTVIECIEDAANTPQIADNHEAQLKESTISGIRNNAEEKVDDLCDSVLDKEVTKVELNELSSTPPVANNNDAMLLHVDDTKTMEKNVVEEEIFVIKELTDTQHDEILINKYANKIELEESIIEGMLENQEITKEDDSKDINPDVTMTEKGDNFESKESVEGVPHASEDDIVKNDHYKLISQREDPTVEELTFNQLEISHQNETAPDKNRIITSTETETAVISHPQLLKTDAELTENKVLSVEMTEKATVDESFINDVDGHKNQVNCETEVDKQLNDHNDKIPDQEPAYCGELIVKYPEEIQAYTTTLNRNDTIIEGDETPESTAVSAMDLETAAITIQKVFRTFLFSKSRASTLEDTANENSLDEDMEKKDVPEYILTSSNLNKERRTLGINRMDTVLQTVNEEKSLSLSDDSSLSSAATTIQAHVRGFLVRNRLASNKTASSSSLVNSDGPSTLSLEGDVNESKKTILNIHIVPERGQFMSRDESLLTSIDLPLDNSPPSSINLHPLGYDKSAERRKQLKREDAVQSISPPSNNSGKLSEEIDSVKDTLNDSIDVDVKKEHEYVCVNGSDKPQDADTESCDTTLTISSTAETVVDADTYNPREVFSSPDHNIEVGNKIHEVVSSSDEMDVVTPYPTITEKTAKVASVESENDQKPKLVHSGEFHDIVVQTQVKRSESSVVREFKSVLVYFLLWDKT